MIVQSRSLNIFLIPVVFPMHFQPIYNSNTKTLPNKAFDQCWPLDPLAVTCSSSRILNILIATRRSPMRRTFVGFELMERTQVLSWQVSWWGCGRLVNSMDSWRQSQYSWWLLLWCWAQISTLVELRRSWLRMPAVTTTSTDTWARWQSRL